MSECTSYTLSELVDRYFMRRGISKKKYYSRYLTLAEEVWQDIFTGTLWVIQSSWKTLKKGEPYNYIDVPSNSLRILSVSVADKCGLLQPLYYNNQLNIIAKPAIKKCGCGCDSCAGLCEDVNSVITTTKVIFTINGQDYSEKCWLKYCKNGDIIQYCETPTKKYLTRTGDSGEFNNDFNPDFNIADPPFSDYEIITVTSQKKICKLETLPCGCPAETPENEQILLDTCGCWLNWDSRRKRKHCKQFSENVNNNHLGEVKISECGTKIFYKPNKHWKQATTVQFPDFLLVNYQTDGSTPGQEILIPKYARNAMFSGLDYESKVYNDKYSQIEKKSSEWKYVDDKNKVIAFLSPFTPEEIGTVQDAQIKW